MINKVLHILLTSRFSFFFRTFFLTLLHYLNFLRWCFTGEKLIEN